MNQTTPEVQALINRGALEHVGWLTPPSHPERLDQLGDFCWPSHPGETAGPPLRPLYAPAVTYRAHTTLADGQHRTLTTNDHAVLRTALDGLRSDGAEVTSVEHLTGT